MNITTKLFTQSAVGVALGYTIVRLVEGRRPKFAIVEIPDYTASIIEMQKSVQKIINEREQRMDPITRYYLDPEVSLEDKLERMKEIHKRNTEI